MVDPAPVRFRAKVICKISVVTASITRGGMDSIIVARGLSTCRRIYDCCVLGTRIRRGDEYGAVVNLLPVPPPIRCRWLPSSKQSKTTCIGWSIIMRTRTSFHDRISSTDLPEDWRTVCNKPPCMT